MRVTHLGHSTVVIETGRVRVLIDPGTLTPALEAVTDLDAVLVTHQHPDHLDPHRLPTLMAANPGARLHVEPQTVAVTAEAGVRARELAPGAALSIGDLRVQAVGEWHALIHERIPRVGNVGLLVSEQDGPTLFHPGDSLEHRPDGVDVLALPLSAPWSSLGQVADFAERSGAGVVVPIHDGLLSPPGRAVFLNALGRVFPGLDVRDLAATGAGTF